jgi:hypothetical protein
MIVLTWYGLHVDLHNDCGRVFLTLDIDGDGR